MASTAFAGATYLIDEGRGKPPHYWVVLTDPDYNGEFVIASLTHAPNYPANDDIWPVGWRLTEDTILSKPSVVHVRFVRVATQEWLNGLDATTLGKSTPRSLRRVRCNTRWFEDQVQPRPRRLLYPFDEGWDRECFE